MSRTYLISIILFFISCTSVRQELIEIRNPSEYVSIEFKVKKLREFIAQNKQDEDQETIKQARRLEDRRNKRP